MIEYAHMDLPELISEYIPIWVQWVLGVLITIGALWALWDRTLGRLAMFRNLWPSMEKWSANALPWQKEDGVPDQGGVLLDENRPLRNPNSRWCQMRNMRLGDYYFLDMQKNRLISRMHLVTHGRDPKKYKIEVFTDEKIDTPQELGEYTNSPIDIKLHPPRKFRKVKFTIIEPDILPNNAKHSWCIYEVRFWKARLLLRWPTWRIQVRR
jgi:hypothetical protein